MITIRWCAISPLSFRLLAFADYLILRWALLSLYFHYAIIYHFSCYCLLIRHYLHYADASFVIDAMPLIITFFLFLADAACLLRHIDATLTLLLLMPLFIDIDISVIIIIFRHLSLYIITFIISFLSLSFDYWYTPLILTWCLIRHYCHYYAMLPLLLLLYMLLILLLIIYAADYAMPLLDVIISPYFAAFFIDAPRHYAFSIHIIATLRHYYYFIIVDIDAFTPLMPLFHCFHVDWHYCLLRHYAIHYCYYYLRHWLPHYAIYYFRHYLSLLHYLLRWYDYYIFTDYFAFRYFHYFTLSDAAFFFLYCFFISCLLIFFAITPFHAWCRHFRLRHITIIISPFSLIAAASFFTPLRHIISVTPLSFRHFHCLLLRFFHIFIDYAFELSSYALNISLSLHYYAAVDIDIAAMPLLTLRHYYYAATLFIYIIFTLVCAMPILRHAAESLLLPPLCRFTPYYACYADIYAIWLYSADYAWLRFIFIILFSFSMPLLMPYYAPPIFSAAITITLWCYLLMMPLMPLWLSFDICYATLIIIFIFRATIIFRRPPHCYANIFFIITPSLAFTLLRHYAIIERHFDYYCWYIIDANMLTCADIFAFDIRHYFHYYYWLLSCHDFRVIALRCRLSHYFRAH